MHVFFFCLLFFLEFLYVVGRIYHVYECVRIFIIDLIEFSENRLLSSLEDVFFNIIKTNLSRLLRVVVVPALY